jgi:hypothetical protein
LMTRAQRPNSIVKVLNSIEQAPIDNGSLFASEDLAVEELRVRKSAVSYCRESPKAWC